MASSLQTLIKILRLEQQKGYQNKAVIGGFARFAYHWAREAHGQAQEQAHHDLVDEIAHLMRSYESAAPDERPALIERIVALATGGTAEQAAAPPVPEAPAAPPPPQPEALSPPSPPPAFEASVEEAVEQVAQEVAAEPAGGPDTSAEDLEFFGTFEREPETEAEIPASVRERRGYAWRQQVPAPPDVLQGLDAPVETVSGVGQSRAALLEHLGIRTVRDLLFAFPRRYDDYSRMKPINRLELGETVTVIGMLERIHARRTKNGTPYVEAYIDDGSAVLRLNWFNQPWMEKQLESGEMIVASGKVDEYLGRLIMNNPEIEPVDRESLHAGRVVPVYPLTKGLSGRILRRIVKQVVDDWAPRLPDHLPLPVRESADLMDYSDAVAQAHFPDTWIDMQDALRRLTFDVLFELQLAMLCQRYRWQSRAGLPLQVDDGWIASFEASLPYALTSAQQRAVADIRRDMASSVPMNRLLQGDVGSGKTVVAALAMGIAVASGAQAALMSPTTILAEQHYATLRSLLAGGPLGADVRVALLTGSVPQAERDAVYTGLADGSIHVVVGTHALIQQGLAFRRLGLAIIDEQHRFGVEQRGALRGKAEGGNPHLLVMTATPIPRTLALTRHADLDLTVIDEMPPGRTPVTTRILQPKERERAYSFIRSRVQQGQQAYIICPLVEDSDRLDARSAAAEYERLQDTIFPDLYLGLLHGRMTPDEKEAAMAAFYRGETQVLVSTTVIEVGIDVPNATVILIENANRFGLAQLHQLRGRVGRGDEPGYCLLLSDQAFLDTDERLRAVEETTDGFKLAEIDWKLRGAGDLLGTRQSGLSSFDFAAWADPHLIDLAQREARALYDLDPELTTPEHQALAARVERYIIEPGDVS